LARRGTAAPCRNCASGSKGSRRANRNVLGALNATVLDAPLDRCDDAPPAPGAARSAPWSCTPPACVEMQRAGTVPAGSCHPDDTDRIRGQHMVPQACGSDGCAVGYRSWRGRFKDRILPGPLRLGASRSALTLRTISGLTCHVSSRLHRRLLSILVMSTMRSLSYFKWGGCNSLVASANRRGSNVPSAVKV
jgi:hypothetical protein